MLTLGVDFPDGIYWPGHMSEMAYYTNALTGTQIAAHYADASSVATYESDVASLNPLLYYKFNDQPYTDPTPTVIPKPFQAGQPLAQNLGSLGTGYNATYEAGTAVAFRAFRTRVLDQTVTR